MQARLLCNLSLVCMHVCVGGKARTRVESVDRRKEGRKKGGREVIRWASGER